MAVQIFTEQSSKLHLRSSEYLCKYGALRDPCDLRKGQIFTSSWAQPLLLPIPESQH